MCIRDRINLQPIRAINKIPKILTGTPAKAKSKKAKSLSTKSFLNSEIIILGGVPIFVFIPPKIDAKDKGIKNLDGFQFIFWQMPRVIGRSIAIAPMLFIKDERIAAKKVIEIINWISLLA